MPDLRPEISEALDKLEQISLAMKQIDPGMGAFGGLVGARHWALNAEHARNISERAQELEALFSHMAERSVR